MTNLEIPDWVEAEIKVRILTVLASDLLVIAEEVIVQKCKNNFKGLNTTCDFDQWVRSLSDQHLIEFLGVVLKRLI